MATTISRGSTFDSLPYEVKTRIFASFPFCERIRLTRVCQSWRHFLLNWPNTFEKVENRCNCSFERDLSYTMCTLNSALLPYARYIQPKVVRELTILMQSDHSAFQKNVMLEDTFDFFIALRLYHVEKCFISITSVHDNWLSKFLQVGSHNLKRLDFMMRPETPMDVAFLDRILIELKHLQEFRLLAFPAHSHDDAEFANLFLVHFDGVDDTIPENWSVKSIDLDSNGSALFMPLDTFVTKLRGLEYVKLNPADIRDPLVVGQALAQCPNLRAVVVDKGSSSSDLDKLKKKKVEGLVYLELNDEFCDPDVYVPLITKHHKTIETLKLDGLILTTGTVRSFIALDFPSLKKLVIKDKTLFMRHVNDDDDHGSFTSAENFDSFIHSFSQLEYLDLSVFCYLTDSMLESLESVTCLKKLELIVCTGVSEQGLLQFLDRSQSRHCLKELNLTGQRCVTNDVLHAIGRDLSALTDLSLTEMNRISLFDGLDRFLDTSPIIGKLSFLNIDCLKGDDDFVPTDKQVNNILHKIQAKIDCWHFLLDIPGKKRRQVRGVDWWIEHYAKKDKRSAEPVQDEDNEQDDEEDSSDDDY